MSIEVHQKTLRGLATGWLHAGSKSEQRPILLLLHGFPDAATSWNKQIEYFASEYEVVAPFVRGAGPSEAPSKLSRYSVEAISLDILQILEDIDPDKKRPIHIVGHDLGAVHAWSVARLLKQRAASLVILNGLTIKQMAKRLRQPRQLLKSWYMLWMQLPLVPELTIGRFTQPFLRKAYALGGLSAANEPDLVTGATAVAGPLNQYRAFLRQMPRAVLASPPRLRCPVLIIWGSEDKFLVPPTRDEFEADAADLTVRIIAGNHWLHREQAPVINTLLADFFKKAHGQEKSL